MRRATHLLLTAALGLVLASCSGGGASTPTCSFKDPAVLATSSPWPKFRHDLENTGTVNDPATYTALSANPGRLRWSFPASDDPAKMAFTASPVINTSEYRMTRIYIGSNDGTLYALRTSDGTQDTGFSFTASDGITSTALICTRDNDDAIFVGSNDGSLYGLNGTGAAQPSYWPFAATGFVSASPTFVGDGTVYVASGNGALSAVCPNGVYRFSISTIGVQSSPAMGPDGSLYFGADDGQLRSVKWEGTFRWAFSASAPILSAPVIDPQSGSVYVADRGGRVFKVEADGSPDPGFNFAPPVGPISSSPALAGDHLIFGSDDGNLYVITSTGDTAGSLVGSFATGAAIASSPAVVIMDESPPLIVVGSNDGNVYFLQDNGQDALTEFRPPFNIGSPVHSSPAIDSDGTVYVGADDGRVYAIGWPLATPTMTATMTPASAPTPTSSGR